MPTNITLTCSKRLQVFCCFQSGIRGYLLRIVCESCLLLHCMTTNGWPPRTVLWDIRLENHNFLPGALYTLAEYPSYGRAFIYSFQFHNRLARGDVINIFQKIIHSNVILYLNIDATYDILFLHRFDRRPSQSHSTLAPSSCTRQLKEIM